MMKLCRPERTISTPFKGAEHGAQCERGENGDEKGRAGSFKEPAATDRDADADGADSEIEPAGHDHHHHRKSDHDVDCGDAAEREQVEGRTETGRAQREDSAEDRDQRDQAEFVGEQEARPSEAPRCDKPSSRTGGSLSTIAAPSIEVGAFMLHPSLSRKYLRDGKKPVAKRIEGEVCGAQAGRIRLVSGLAVASTLRDPPAQGQVR